MGDEVYHIFEFIGNDISYNVGARRQLFANRVFSQTNLLLKYPFSYIPIYLEKMQNVYTWKFSFYIKVDSKRDVFLFWFPIWSDKINIAIALAERR